MKLFGSPLSPFVRKVLAYAEEKGIALELVPTALGDRGEEFRRASPFGTMPAFVDGDFAIADSTAIITYLEARFPEPALIPAEPEARARTIWFEEFADTMLAATGRRMFFNRIVSPLFLKQPGNEAAADAAEADEVPPLLDYLESVAPADGWLVGAGLTLADVAVASPFVNFHHAGLAIDAARYPRLTAYLARVHARPSFAESIARETRAIARARGG